jgi:NAD(P)-dependent dehydrogenase (short-subunit alcohol dehydrogenase family)
MLAKSKQIKEKAMTKLAEIDDLFTETKKRFGKIDILFVNAGVGIFRPFETVTEADFDTQMNVNLKGAYFTIQKALPLLNDSAAIVLNSSINAHIGMPNSSMNKRLQASSSQRIVRVTPPAKLGEDFVGQGKGGCLMGFGRKPGGMTCFIGFARSRPTSTSAAERIGSSTVSETAGVVNAGLSSS